MPCPTCGGDLTCLLCCPDMDAVYHCGVCGTAVVERDTGREVCIPKLVTRCRKYADHAARSESSWAGWVGLGISESIHLPEDRPT